MTASGDVVVVATVPTYAPYGDIRDYAVKLFENGGKGIGETTAERIKKDVPGMNVMTVGLIVLPEQANEIIASGKAAGPKIVAVAADS